MKTLTKYGETCFQGHASVIHKYYNNNQAHFLLLDPWFDMPAFGSWLPSFVPAVSKEKLLTLAVDKKLTVIVSHAHDDHCDDKFIQMLPETTQFIIPKFISPGLMRRLNKLGMKNIIEVDTNGVEVNGVLLKSFINEGISLDDAIITIETGAEALIHNNDNWAPYSDTILSNIQKIVERFGDNVLFMSQTNSASGYPFTYDNYTLEEKKEINHKKVISMVKSGIENCEKVNAKHFLSYAGYASVYVKGSEYFLNESITPTQKWILDNVDVGNTNVLDMLPGDVFDFQSASVKSSFYKDAYKSDSYNNCRNEFYQREGLIDNCDTYSDLDIVSSNFFPGKINYFLEGLNRFVTDRVENVEFFSTIQGKSFTILIEDMGLATTLVFGHGLIDQLEISDKQVIVSSAMMQKVLDGSILFENLYTGYEAKWRRKGDYNRDIIMALVMYSYFYRNVLSRSCP
jgi:L-ascorbate metabolism protein UlaG (beta-lactamase superfamily)